MKINIFSKMAVTRRGYIFGAFLLSVLSVVLILISIASDSWVVSTATAYFQYRDSSIQYGLFSGILVLYNFPTPTYNTLYMTCVTSVGVCALSCKTEDEARIIEVEALANAYRPSPSCVAVTVVDTSNPLPVPPVISFAFYVCLLLILFLQLIFAVIAAGLAITNATRNPTEPIFGLPGCLWTNIVTAVLGVVALLMFGVYWATSGLQQHLALSYIAVGMFVPSPGLGYSFWVLMLSILCNLSNVALIKSRGFLLERNPSPSTIKIENHADANTFSY